MDDEFKLCWKNFQDNIASGFQNLYDRGDLVDVTLACDGKLLHAHKIVLAICSPYFQEIFITNPCKHPIIILKDVSFNIMCELLEFMYQGVVNVKHAELQSFMKIGQLLQIKGLATNSSSSTASTTSDKSSAQTPTNDDANNVGNEPGSSSNTKGGNSETPNSVEGNSGSKTASQNASASLKVQSPPSSPIPLSFTSPLNQHNFKNSHDSNSSTLHQSYHGGAGYKRHAEFGSDTLSIYSRKQIRRSLNALEHGNDHNDTSEGGSSMDQVGADDFFLPSIPHISMVESRYDLNNVKREGDHLGPGTTSASALRNSFPPSFGFDYNLYKNNSGVNSGTEYPNELHMPNDYSKNFGNHMDIPPNGSNVVMLSSTSLLHGNCIFNRNNTVATQQGMRTYWLCKSYRISMCRARCITYQGRVISATGSHNHPPHMRGNNNNSSTPTVYGPDGSTSATSAIQPTNPGPTSSVNSGNGPITTNIHSNNLRLPPVPPPPQIYQHNSHGPNGQPHHLHNPQQQLLPPAQAGPHAPTSNAMIPPPGHSHHIAPTLPNLLAPQHVPSSGPSNLPQQSNGGNEASTSQSQHVSNTVIHSMMHNANIMHLSNMPHMLHVDPNNQQSPHLSEHSHPHPHPQHHPHSHQQNVGSNLEITRLIESSPGQMESPSNRSNQSHHGGNSISSPLPMDSPAQANISEDARMSSEQQVLVNTALSPSEMNSNVTVSSAEVNAPSQSDNSNDVRHQAHVINSITISPASHSFKMENM